MESTVEESGRHTVVLTVEVPPEEFARDLDRAYRRIGQQIKVPGFRKGHVPRRIIDAQIGRDAVMQEFIEDALPQYYSEAVREHELAPIADPEISLEKSDEGQPLVFSATVEVRPRLQLEGWREDIADVEPPDATVTDSDVDQFVDRLRDRFAEVETVGRPAQRGDYVLADIRGTVHGEEITFQVLVKEVKAKKLPAVDDEFAKMASEFDTLQELRDDLREKLGEAKAAEARGEFRDRLLRALVVQVDIELPERLVDHETEHRVQEATRRAERAGLTLEQVLEAQEWDELRFRSDARAHATRAIKSDLVLEAIARQEGVTVSAEEIAAAVQDLAQALGREPKEVAKTIERTGQVTSLAGDIIRSKALDLLVEAAEGDRGPTSEEPADTRPEGTEAPDHSTGNNQGATK